MKHIKSTLTSLKAALMIGIFVLGFVFVANAYTQPPSSTLSTPELIEADVAQGEISAETGYLYLSYALFEFDKLPEKYHSSVPWSGTSYIMQLQEATAMMPATLEMAGINRALAGACDDSSGAMANTINSTHFHIEYGTIGGGLDIDDYTQALETTWVTEIDTFGWAAPPVLVNNPPPGNRYHVRIDALGSGLYGFVHDVGAHAGFVGDNPNTAWTESNASASCMVVNNDFSVFGGTPQNALNATMAHEFNHSIQMGYGAGTETADVFWEAGASWMEDEVFDDANDNYNYLWPEFSNCMVGAGSEGYSEWITYRGLTERFGTGVADGGEQVMQDFWEETSKGTNIGLDALNVGLQNKGSNLPDAFHEYAVAVKFNKSCGGGTNYPYCLEEGADYVAAKGNTAVHGSINSIGNSFSNEVQDNYALSWVSLPTNGGPYKVSLQNSSSGGKLRGSVVCDTGSSLQVTPMSLVAGAGETAVVNYFNPAGCSSVVAVITNQAQTAANPTSCTGRSYTLTLGTPPLLDKKVYLPAILK